MYSRNEIDGRKLLRQLPLFSGLGAALVAEIAGHARSLAFQRGEPIYRFGERAEALYVVLAGQVKLALSSNRGQEKVIDVIDPGRTFGEAELLGPHSCIAGAVAVKPTQVLRIDGAAVRYALARDVRFAQRIIETLAQRHIQMEAELAASHFCTGSQRLLEFFLWLAGPERDAQGETRVTLNISKRLLASRFDMQPETLSRALRELSEAGLIAVDKSHITLRNAAIGRYLAEEATAQSIILPEQLRSPHAAGSGYGAINQPAADDDEDTRSRQHAINLAGRQRMLSQRMAKVWLMQERGVMVRRARAILRQSTALFDAQMAELETRGAGNAECRAAGKALAELWPRYRALIAAAPDDEAVRGLFALKDTVLDATERLVKAFEHADGTAHGRLINTAGRLRMLSQRAATFFMFHHMGIHRAQSRAELKRIDEEFNATLEQIAQATRGQQRIRDELDMVRRHWTTLQSIMTLQRVQSFPPLARRVFEVSENLLQRMDTAVTLCTGLSD